MMIYNWDRKALKNRKLLSLHQISKLRNLTFNQNVPQFEMYHRKILQEVTRNLNRHSYPIQMLYNLLSQNKPQLLMLNLLWKITSLHIGHRQVKVSFRQNKRNLQWLSNIQSPRSVLQLWTITRILTVFSIQ